MTAIHFHFHRITAIHFHFHVGHQFLRVIIVYRWIAWSDFHLGILKHLVGFPSNPWWRFHALDRFPCLAWNSNRLGLISIPLHGNPSDSSIPAWCGSDHLISSSTNLYWPSTSQYCHILTQYHQVPLIIHHLMSHAQYTWSSFALNYNMKFVEESEIEFHFGHQPFQ